MTESNNNKCFAQSIVMIYDQAAKKFQLLKSVRRTNVFIDKNNQLENFPH